MLAAATGVPPSRRRLRPRPTLVALTLLACCCGSAVTGQPPSHEDELDSIRKRIATLEERLRSVDRKKEGLTGELVETEVELQLQQERVEEARLAVERAQEKEGEVEEQVRALAGAMDDLRQVLRRRLGGLYRLGRQGYLRLLLSVESEDDLLPALRQLRYLARRDSDLLERYLATQESLAEQQAELEMRRRESERWLEREGERLAELERLRRRKAEVLAELEREGRRLRTESEQLIEREGKLATLLQALEGELALDERPIQEFEGVLDRPVEGSVVEGFGPRRDPRYRTAVPHNGLQFVTLEGAEVRAVYPGRVLYAAELEGYGLTVIVLHPDHVFTLYAGLEDLRAKVGDVLSLRGLIGESRGNLYFEIRVDNRPVDPEEWLR